MYTNCTIMLDGRDDLYLWRGHIANAREEQRTRAAHLYQLQDIDSVLEETRPQYSIDGIAHGILVQTQLPSATIEYYFAHMDTAPEDDSEGLIIMEAQAPAPTVPTLTIAERLNLMQTAAGTLDRVIRAHLLMLGTHEDIATPIMLALSSHYHTIRQCREINQENPERSADLLSLAEKRLEEMIAVYTDSRAQLYSAITRQDSELEAALRALGIE